MIYNYKQEKALDSNAAYSGLLSGQATPEASRYSNALASDDSKKKVVPKLAIVNIEIQKAP